MWRSQTKDLFRDKRDDGQERVCESAKEKRKWAGLRLSKLSTAQHEWITEILKDQLLPGKPTCYRKLDLLVVLISLPSFLPLYSARVPGVPLKFTNSVYHGGTADLPPLNELIPRSREDTICEGSSCGVTIAKNQQISSKNSFWRNMLESRLLSRLYMISLRHYMLLS